MAHLTLDGNKIVARCEDGTTYTTAITVDPQQLGNLKSLAQDAIDDAFLKAAKKKDEAHKDEIGDMDAANEAKLLRGRLTAVQPTPKKEKKPAVPPQKRITAPAPAPPKESVTPTLNWLGTELTEAEKDGPGAVATAIYNSGLDRKLGTSEEHLMAATRIVFAALSKIQGFKLNLEAMTKRDDGATFVPLNEYVKAHNDLSGADKSIINAANVYIRYFLLYLGVAGIPDYERELSQLPKCKNAMDNFEKTPSDLKPLVGPMGSETVIAAALYIRRWNLEQPDMKSVPIWQMPETIAAAREVPVVHMQLMARDTTLDRAKREIPTW